MTFDRSLRSKSTSIVKPPKATKQKRPIKVPNHGENPKDQNLSLAIQQFISFLEEEDHGRQQESRDRPLG